MGLGLSLFGERSKSPHILYNVTARLCGMTIQLTLFLCLAGLLRSLHLQRPKHQ